jgi:hypothetical protein|nr:MAG TPA: hypothetical protein [Crassvirales sp.]
MKGLAVYRVVRGVRNATELSRTLLTVISDPNLDSIPTLTSSLNSLAVAQFNPNADTYASYYLESTDIQDLSTLLSSLDNLQQKLHLTKVLSELDFSNSTELDFAISEANVRTINGKGGTVADIRKTLVTAAKKD